MKLFNFGGVKFRSLTKLDMFADTRTRGFQIICNITILNNYYVWDLIIVDCPTHEIHEIKCPTKKKIAQ